MTLSKFRWTGLTCLGLALGAGIGLPLAPPVESILGAMAVLPVVGGVLGAVLGALQALTLRRGMASSAWWVLASSIGMGIGLTLGTVAAEVSGLERRGLELVLAILLIGGIAGLALGCAQAAVVRASRAFAARWVAANAAGLAAGGSLGWILAETFAGGAMSPLSFAALAVTGGVGLGLATSAVLRASLRA